MDEIKSAVVARMNDRNLTPWRLAREANVEYRCMTRWLAGEGNVGLKTLTRICTTLGLSIRVENTEAPNGV